LGPTLFYVMFYPAFMVLVSLLVGVTQNCGCLNRLFTVLQNMLLFSFILRMLIEVSIEIYMAGFISLVDKRMDSLINTVSYITSWIALLFLVAVIVLLPLFLEKNAAKLQEPEFKKKYGSIYEEISSHNKFAKYFYSFFLARRFIVALALVFLGEWPGG